MKRFLTGVILFGGLTAVDAVFAIDLGTITTTNCMSAGGYSQTTVVGNVGDTFTLQNLSGGPCNGFRPTDTAVFGPSPVNLSNGGSAVFTLSAPGSAALFFVYFNPITVTVNSVPPSQVPTLSEWAQIILALMVISIAWWTFHHTRESGK